MADPKRNIGASVRARLLNIARDRKQPFDLLLTRYVLERLLYRLSISKYRDRFVLKGAMLLTTWFENPLRPTRDLDLLGFGESNPEAIAAIFREVCAIAAPDAVIFDIDGLAIDRIREELEYGGLRIKTTATIDGARIRVVVDVGFGDATEPGLTDLELAVLLDFPSPSLRSYPRETVIAEKFQAMVMLAGANTRLKDFYDIWALVRSYEFDTDRLAQAIAATFERRNTAIPAEIPHALTREFAEDPAKQKQWETFIANVADNPGSLAKVVSEITRFLMDAAAHARRARNRG
jgi:predicted nucleotidyltransferase component of viral defense system